LEESFDGTECSICRRGEEDCIVGGGGKFILCKECYKTLMSQEPVQQYEKCRMCSRSAQAISIDQRVGICIDDIQLCNESFDLVIS